VYGGEAESAFGTVVATAAVVLVVAMGVVTAVAAVVVVVRCSELV